MPQADYIWHDVLFGDAINDSLCKTISGPYYDLLNPDCCRGPVPPLHFARDANIVIPDYAHHGWPTTGSRYFLPVLDPVELTNALLGCAPK